MGLAAWPLQDRAAYTQAPKLLQTKGAALLRYSVAVLLERGSLSTCRSTPRSRRPSACHRRGKNVIRAALVLCADHELNTSAFATRCAASTRAPLHAALISGLGRLCRSAPRRRLRPGDRLAVRRSRPRPTSRQNCPTGSAAANPCPVSVIPFTATRIRAPNACLKVLYRSRTGPPLRPAPARPGRCRPGLSSESRRMSIWPWRRSRRPMICPGMPARSSSVPARMTGWIAHALEQYATPEQIRPRAAYVGERPE